MTHADTPFGKLVHGLDVRLGAAQFTKSKLNYVFPEQFSFLFGEVALYSFIALVATGIFLMLFYSPSEAPVIYHGAYVPLRGVRMSEAYRSVMELSFDVRAGLLMRQIHHWAALVFTGSMAAHLCRVFFTGAFRKPRELNWVTGVILLIVSVLEGFMGYSLLDDLLSGAGVRIANAVVQSIPVVGSTAAFFLWGGEYPGTGFLGRLLTLHIFLVPALITTLIVVHLALVVRQKHTQFPGKGRTERNVVGARMWPTYATMSTGLALMVGGVLVVMGGWLQINPVWLYGPYDPFTITSGAQADYYVLWIQGTLRLMPPLEVRAWGFTIPNPFFPGILLPLILFGLLFAWPWLEALATKDWRTHHLLDRPRDRPVRTALGVAAITYVTQLLIAGSDDVIAVEAGWSIVAFRNVERLLLLVLPVITGLTAYRVARDLREDKPLPDEPEPDEAPELEPGLATTSDGQNQEPAGRHLIRNGMLVALAATVAQRLRRRRHQT
ncbi:MAG: cytochrome bc1 complex cytochrome b subunit [Egibacteraceae bacterium]